MDPTAPSTAPPAQQRHQPSALRRRILAALLVGFIILCVVGGFVWRLVYVYNEYKLGKGVATNDTAASQSALHTLAVMRGIGLVVFGVLHLALAAIDYFREPEGKRSWTTHDTIETGVGVLFVGAGVALCYNDRFALVGMR